MRILVIGCGSIGRRHIRLLREMGVDVDAYDADEGVRSRLRSEFPGIRVATGLESVLLWSQGQSCDGAIVATPPHCHAEPTIQALKCGMGVLVEKPLATTLEDAALMLGSAYINLKPLLVGYNLRFHPGLRKVKELLDNGAVGEPLHATITCGSYLPSWRPNTDYRQNYACRHETGGGVLLDISHELDYACWFFGEPDAVACLSTTTGALEGLQTEDVADVLIRFKSGVQANVHLDYIRHDRKRGCEIVGTEGTLVWDRGTEQVCRRRGDYATYYWVGNPKNVDDMYRAQLRNFLGVIRGEETPVCTGEDGLRALRLALAARESAESGKVVTL